MSFHAVEYLAFLPLVTVIYFILAGSARRVFLLTASFAFYAFFSLPLSLLLVWSTVLDYTAARCVQSARKEWQRKAALLASIVGNLGTLATFKYIDFFNESLAALLGFSPWPMLHLVLPMGISFYTFQTMSYTIDVYRGHCEARRSILDVALYVSFFPQLVAGPIMRADELLPQFQEKHAPDLERFLSGALLVCWGLLKKVFVADTIGRIVDGVYGTTANPSYISAYSGAALLFATYGFAVQIYCDFSAYSDIAVGSARILGIRLVRNFDAPYLATSIQDFWRRWHISLSTWLRDYVYIPLGGNRRGWRRTWLALMTTMLLGGLWHGASWTFVVWGGLQGVFLIVERWATSTSKHAPLGGPQVAANQWRSTRRLLRWIITFHLVCLSWVFFRSESVTQAMAVIAGILSWQSGTMISAAPLVALTLLLSTQLLKRHVTFHDVLMGHPHLARWTVYASTAIVLFAVSKAASPEFIYFQF